MGLFVFTKLWDPDSEIHISATQKSEENYELWLYASKLSESGLFNVLCPNDDPMDCLGIYKKEELSIFRVWPDTITFREVPYAIDDNAPLIVNKFQA